MKFKEEKIEGFLKHFEQNKIKIRNFEGCNFLELLQDTEDKTIFFTHSHWESNEDLQNYRKSEFFINVWSNTTPLFAQKAEAWSLQTEG